MDPSGVRGRRSDKGISYGAYDVLLSHPGLTALVTGSEVLGNRFFFLFSQQAERVIGHEIANMRRFS